MAGHLVLPATRTSPFVVYNRLVGIAFLLVAAYTVWVKLPSGRFATDWLHTVVHLITGAAALYVGWLQVDGVAPRALTWLVTVGYGVLGIVGWLIDGLAMSTSFRIPLTAADNIFHLLLAGTGLVTIYRAVTIRE